MTKLLKALLGLIMLLGLLVAGLLLFVDPNDFHDEIAAQVKQATGQDLHIKGDIGLLIFPWLGVELEGLSLGQPAGFGTTPFLEVTHAQSRIRLMPLLHRRLEIDTLVLDGLRLNLIRNAQGQDNWENLSQWTSGQVLPTEAVPNQVQVSDGDLGADPSGWVVGSVQISDALISWEDRLSGQRATLRNLSGTVRILPGARPGYRFAITLDGLDLDRHPPAGPARSPTPASQPSPLVVTATEAPLFQVAQLRTLDLDGSLRVGRLVAYGLRLEDAQIALKAQGGRLALEQQVARFYQGRLGGTLGIDVTGAVPRVRVLQRIQGVQMEPLLHDWTGQDRLSGRGDFDLEVSGSGATLEALKRSLDGHLAFAFNNGALKGVNLGRMLREAAARIRGKTLAPDQEADATDFSELRGSALIHDGVLRNDDLSAKSPLFRLTGAGSLDLGRNTLDYLIKPVLVATLQGQGGEDLNRLQGIPIPVHLKGPLNRPDWSIELAEALTGAQKAHLGEQLDAELRKRLPQAIQDKLPKGLFKGLFH